MTHKSTEEIDQLIADTIKATVEKCHEEVEELKLPFKGTELYDHDKSYLSAIDDAQTALRALLE